MIFRIFGVYSAEAAVVTLTLNCLLSAFTCIPLYYLAKPLFGAGTARIATIIYAVYPPPIWHSITTIWEATLFTFLIVVLLSWTIRLPHRLNASEAGIFGAFLGIILLVSPVIIIIYPFLMLWIFRHSKLDKSTCVAYLAMMSCLAFTVALPWVLRNYRVFRRPILKSNFGLELRLENNATSWKGLKSNPGLTAVELGHPSLDRKEFEKYAKLGEMKYIDQSYQQATTWIRENPGKFMWLTAGRIVNFWLGDWSAPPGWKGTLKTNYDFTIIKRLCHVLPLPFTFWGVILAFRRNLQIGPLIFLLALLPAVYYVTHVSQRYRCPIEPIIVIFAAHALSQLATWYITRGKGIAR